MTDAKKYCVIVKSHYCAGRTITKSLIMDGCDLFESGETSLDKALEKLNEFRYGDDVIKRSKVISFEVYPVADLRDRSDL